METDAEQVELASGAGAWNLGLRTERRWRIVVPRVRVLRILEMEDVHFHYKSVVLMPDPHASAEEPPNPDRITGLSVIRTALEFHRRFPDKRLLLAGHADSVGSQDYNVTLSRQRARNVLAYLVGDREAWAASCQERFQVEDWQQILKWWAAARGWDCDPGPVDNVSGEASRAALRRFRARHSVEFGRSIPERGPITPDDWRAFADCYDDELARLLGCPVSELASRRAGFTFVEDGAVGCGESWPVEAVGDNRRSRLNRRVELLFFDAIEQPPLACHAGGACDPSACVVYQGSRYRRRYLPVDVASYADGDLNVLALEWDDDLTPQLPADLVLRLEVDGRPPAEQPWARGVVVEGLRQFVFDDVPSAAACTLIARGATGERVLLDRQVVDDPEEPPRFAHALDELRVADDSTEPPFEPGEPMPDDHDPDHFG